MIEAFELQALLSHSGEKLMVKSLNVTMNTKGIYARDPNIYGRGQDNIYYPPSQKKVDILAVDHEGNDYKFSFKVMEFSISESKQEPEEL